MKDQGLGLSRPNRIQGYAVMMPHSPFAAQSRIMSRRSPRAIVPTNQHRAVLAAVKAGPGEKQTMWLQHNHGQP
jgi:hypothetical protein